MPRSGTYRRLGVRTRSPNRRPRSRLPECDLIGVLSRRGPPCASGVLPGDPLFCEPIVSRCPGQRARPRSAGERHDRLAPHLRLKDWRIGMEVSRQLGGVIGSGLRRGMTLGLDTPMPPEPVGEQSNGRLGIEHHAPGPTVGGTL
jgi:hypothetical protein